MCWLYYNHLLWRIPLWEHQYHGRVEGMKRGSSRHYNSVDNECCLHREGTASTFLLSYLGVESLHLVLFSIMHSFKKWPFVKHLAIYFSTKISLPITFIFHSDELLHGSLGYPPPAASPPVPSAWLSNTA